MNLYIFDNASVSVMLLPMLLLYIFIMLLLKHFSGILKHRFRYQFLTVVLLYYTLHIL